MKIEQENATTNAYLYQRQPVVQPPTAVLSGLLLYGAPALRYAMHCCDSQNLNSGCSMKIGAQRRMAMCLAHLELQFCSNALLCSSDLLLHVHVVCSKAHGMLRVQCRDKHEAQSTHGFATMPPC